MKTGPVLIEIDDDTAPSVANAAPVPDEFNLAAMPEGQAMQTAARLSARAPSRLAKWLLGLMTALFSTVLSIVAWDFAVGLLERAPILGWIVTALFTAFVVVLMMVALKELAGFSRLRRIDGLRAAAQNVQTISQAQGVVEKILKLYNGRKDVSWGAQRFQERRADAIDADTLLGLAEREVLSPLDRAAGAEIEASARQVATITALVPLALVDVVAALTLNMRMIRRIAEIYGGRAGTLGSWRLLRAVMAHLVATGAVAIGDDMIGSFAGGGVLSKLSRRFGEGLVNGALTARVGVAAMEVCRPLPFVAAKRPSVSGLVTRALTGVFGKSDETKTT